MTVWNPRRGVEPCQGLIRSFHRGKFIGCSKVREKQIKRRNIFAPASPDVRLGIVSEQIERRPAEKYEWHSRQQRRKYEIQVSPEGGEIGLIAGDKYGSRGQLAHTWLLSLGWWGLPLSPPRVWLLSADNAANFAPCCSLHNFIKHLATWVRTGWILRKCLFWIGRVFATRKVARKQNKMSVFSTALHFPKGNLICCFLL